MRWSLKIAEVAGIGIYVHWTFLILLAWFAYMHASRGGNPILILEGVGLVLAVFGCVVLHELGHALTARRYGIQTRDITLLPIGGVARLERMPEDPWQEFCVAVAGPLVNVVIAAVLLAVIVVIGGLDQLLNSEMSVESLLGKTTFLIELMVINVFLVVFNMLPAFPMDGGRVLRALLATQMSRVRATHIAATIGQGMAILFGILGLFWNWVLLFIAIFVYLGAQAEAHAVELRAIFQGVRVRDVMVTRFQALAPGDPLQHATSELLAGHQQDFPVIEHGQVTGMLVRSDLFKAMSTADSRSLVGEVMRADCAAVEDTERLDVAIQQMQSADCSTLPVVRDGQLVGLLTSENIGEWAMIQSALRERQRHQQPEP